jgi:hypothetical protein
MGSLFYYCERKDALWQVLDHFINIFYFISVVVVGAGVQQQQPAPSPPARQRWGGQDPHRLSGGARQDPHPHRSEFHCRLGSQTCAMGFWIPYIICQYLCTGNK